MPEITIIQIQKALNLPITGTFIADTLMVKPVRTEKRAMFWTAEQYVEICNALDRHLAEGRANDPTAQDGSRAKKVEAPAAAAAPATAEAGNADDMFGEAAPAGDAGDMFGEAPAATADDLF